MARQQRRYLGAAIVGGWFGVQGETVLRWLERHDDFPQPDVIILLRRGYVCGWSPEREAEIRAWSAHRRKTDYLLDRGGWHHR